MRHVAQIVILLQYVEQQINHTQVLQQHMVQIHSVLLVLRHHLLLHSLQHEEVYHGHVVHHKVEQRYHVLQTDQIHELRHEVLFLQLQIHILCVLLRQTMCYLEQS